MRDAAGDSGLPVAERNQLDAERAARLEREPHLLAGPVARRLRGTGDCDTLYVSSEGVQPDNV